MYVTAVSSFFNPYDVARLSGVQPRNEQAETRNTQQNSSQSSERVIQGEVLRRPQIQNENISTTRDALSGRQFSQEQAQGQSNFGFNSRQAVNTYIGNQLQGERIDRQNDIDGEGIIDVFV